MTAAKNKKKSSTPSRGAQTFTRPPRVALIIETSTLFGRKLLGGIAQYMRENEQWSVYLTDRAVNDSTPEWIGGWEGEGIITRIASPEIRETIAQRRIPAVDLNEQLAGLGMPMISNDHVAIGRMAAEHLLDRGFQRFGYLGHPGHTWSDRRGAAFAERVGEAGFPCHTYRGQINAVSALREGAWEVEMDAIAAWVARLPRPAGLMACHDFRALQLLSACRLAGIAVPEQAAVIGVGADDVACELADPPLSSVVLNAWRMGYEAAGLLDRMMQGKAVSRLQLHIPPLDVSARQSTDVTAIENPIVAAACRFIREHACEGINVESLLRHLGISRTSLQDHFRRELRVSVHDVLVEARLTRVKELLAETSLSLDTVAERCGFRHTEYMSSMLRQRTGWTPARYRREHGRSRV